MSFFLDVSSRLPCLSLGFESGCVTLHMLIDDVNFLPIALLMKKGKKATWPVLAVLEGHVLQLLVLFA